jgi:hypothetical protein
MAAVKKYSAIEILRLNTPENFKRLENSVLQAKFKAIEARCQEIMPSTLKKESNIERQPLGPTKAHQKTGNALGNTRPRLSKKASKPACCPEAQAKIDLVAELLQKEVQKQARKKKNYLRRKRARLARHNKRALEQERLKLVSLGLGSEGAITQSSGVSSASDSECRKLSECEKENYDLPHVIVSLKVAELTSVERLPSSKDMQRISPPRRLSCS